MKNVLIFTHGDGDGICAGAITHRALIGKKVNYITIIFTQPFDFHHKLNDLISNGDAEQFDTIFILDLAYKSNIEPHLATLERSKQIIYIDHHTNSLDIQNRYDGVINVEYSTSMLCSHYFNVLTPLAKLGSVCDKKLMLVRDDRILKEAELLRKALTCDVTDDDFRNDVLLFLSYGELMPSEMPEIIDRARRSDEERDRLLEIAQKNIAYRDDNLTIINLRGIDLSGHAGNIASHFAIENRGTAFIIYGEAKTIITGRSHKDVYKLHIGNMMRNYGGGGHRTAGSGNIKNNEDPALVIEKIRQEVSDVLKGAE